MSVLSLVRPIRVGCSLHESLPVSVRSAARLSRRPLAAPRYSTNHTSCQRWMNRRTPLTQMIDGVQRETGGGAFLPRPLRQRRETGCRAWEGRRLGGVDVSDVLEPLMETFLNSLVIIVSCIIVTIVNETQTSATGLAQFRRFFLEKPFLDPTVWMNHCIQDTFCIQDTSEPHKAARSLRSASTDRRHFELITRQNQDCVLSWLLIGGTSSSLTSGQQDVSTSSTRN